MKIVETQALIHKIGPALTTKYIGALKQLGVGDSAARKCVQRATADHTKLAGIRFEKNTRFIYTPEDYGTPRFWRNFDEACYTHGKSYWAAMTNLRARGGTCRLDRFEQVSGAPIARKGQLSPALILERLKAVNVLEEFVDNDETYLRFQSRYLRTAPIELIRANELAEFVALHGIKEWARRLGLGSYNKFNMRGGDAPPIVSGITFDLTAPAYFRPLLQIFDGAPKPGFLVCDINTFEIMKEPEVEAFVRKCDGAAFSAKIGRIMPMLVADVFSAKGMDLAKSKGILAITLENLFGAELARALRDLVRLLTDTGATAAVNPDHLSRVLKSLTKIEGASSNLRGALFELVVGSLVKDVEGGSLKTGFKIRDLYTMEKAEIDVQLDKTKHAGFLIIECKAKNPGARVSEKEAKRWYDDRVPLIHRILNTGFKEVERPFHFEIWTNGIFAASALAWLEAQPKTCEGYTIDWKDGAALKAYADKASNGSLREMLNEHYFKNPMTSVVADHLLDPKDT
ncbi:hypothetical protein [Sulfitobacter sp. CW3]|uniref:hypothetical protein n=1 Tax=Sulfitobacter sp. CW3 TaxID=2861965 RepID=UPI001C5F5970|nr:hypothetical protein [Sulfitobacter sp. CW3]MBW4963855.1 hypothetical protein [Sulfitobacter sp. CW3]|tara:strand:- start:33 stop:1574 length:1542 start_codon:yes stop_codon:yes gene_type:complete